jgi:hypothetical protein
MYVLLYDLQHHRLVLVSVAHYGILVLNKISSCKLVSFRYWSLLEGRNIKEGFPKKI